MLLSSYLLKYFIEMFCKLHVEVVGSLLLDSLHIDHIIAIFLVLEFGGREALDLEKFRVGSRVRRAWMLPWTL